MNLKKLLLYKEIMLDTHKYIEKHYPKFEFMSEEERIKVFYEIHNTLRK